MEHENLNTEEIANSDLGAVRKRILFLKKKIEKLEIRYADVCEYAGEWSLAAEKLDKQILMLNDELSSLYNLVSKRFIELTREDLDKFKSDLPIDEISIDDFKSSSISRDEINKAELITFKDGEQLKELKNRYRVW